MPGTKANIIITGQNVGSQGKYYYYRAKVPGTRAKCREPGQNAGNQGKMLGARANIIITGQKKKSGSIILGIIISNKNSPNSYYFEGIFGGVSEACIICTPRGVGPPPSVICFFHQVIHELLHQIIVLSISHSL
jgi:hypothetical protein